MDSSNFNELVLERKKEKVIRTVYLACEFCHLSIPTINFGGCPLEGVSRPESGHYHLDGSKICISEKQLRKQSEEQLEETTIHEVIHHLGLMHGSAEEKSRFEQIKNYVRSRVWRPPQGVHFVSGKVVSDESKRIRDDPERFARVNEDSDLVKFLEGRPTSYSSTNKPNSQKSEEIQGINDVDKEDKTAKQNERKVKKNRKKVEKTPKPELETKYNPMTKEEIQKVRDKIGITNEYKIRCKIPSCKRPVVYSCEYCGGNFCKFHINHLIATDKEEIEALSNSRDIEKYDKYLEEYEIKNGHPCVPYTKHWNATRKKKGFFKNIKDALGFVD